MPEKLVVGLKSPSDTTIYALVLRLKNQENNPDHFIDKISNFVEEMRIESEQQRDSPVRQRAEKPAPTTTTQVAVAEPVPGTSTEVEQANKLVMEVEQFNAAIEAPPKGNDFQCFINQPGVVGAVFNNDPCISLNKFDVIQCSDDRDDDEFFHLTCHVDSTLKARIEKGEFVDLERLLPKKRTKEEGRLEWVNRDGLTYLAPQDKEQKIKNVRRWDQAFRIYASIYCNANPSHAGEIWQYIHVINSAASTYVWENVSNYDVTFCQMMAERPGRSWNKIYTQYWQLALKEHINKNPGFTSGGNSSNAGNSQGSNKKQKTWHENCCWVFNKHGKCNRQSCNFDNRCSYCGAWSHSANVCKKKLGDKDKK